MFFPRLREDHDVVSVTQAEVGEDLLVYEVVACSASVDQAESCSGALPRRLVLFAVRSGESRVFPWARDGREVLLTADVLNEMVDDRLRVIGRDSHAVDRSTVRAEAPRDVLLLGQDDGSRVGGGAGLDDTDGHHFAHLPLDVVTFRREVMVRRHPERVLVRYLNIGLGEVRLRQLARPVEYGGVPQQDLPESSLVLLVEGVCHLFT